LLEELASDVRLSVEVRLMNGLIFALSQHGDRRGVRSLSLTELERLTGGSRSAIARALRRWAADGILQVSGAGAERRTYRFGVGVDAYTDPAGVWASTPTELWASTPSGVGVNGHTTRAIPLTKAPLQELEGLLKEARELGHPAAESWAAEVSRRRAAGEAREAIAISLGGRIREQLEAAQA